MKRLPGRVVWRRRDVFDETIDGYTMVPRVERCGNTRADGGSQMFAFFNSHPKGRTNEGVQPANGERSEQRRSADADAPGDSSGGRGSKRAGVEEAET